MNTLPMIAVKIGDVFTPPDHMWITVEALGEKPRHGHDCFDGGSIDETYTCIVRGVLNGEALLETRCDHTPFGAAAASGLIFAHPIADLVTWRSRAEENRVRKRNRHEAVMKALGRM